MVSTYPYYQTKHASERRIWRNENKLINSDKICVSSSPFAHSSINKTEGKRDSHCACLYLQACSMQCNVSITSQVFNHPFHEQFDLKRTLTFLESEHTLKSNPQLHVEAVCN